MKPLLWTALLLWITLTGVAVLPTAAHAEDDAAPATEQTPAQKILALIDQEDLQAAAAALQRAVADNPQNAELVTVRERLAVAFARSRDYQGAAEQYGKLLERELATSDDADAAMPLYRRLSAVSVYFQRADRRAEILPAIRRVETRLTELIGADAMSPAVEALLNVHKLHAGRLAPDDRDAAEALLRADHGAMRALHHEQDAERSGQLLAVALGNLFRFLPTGDERTRLFEAHQELTGKFAEAGRSLFAVRHLSAGVSQLSRIYRSDPETAERLLQSLQNTIETWSADDRLKSTLRVYTRSLALYPRRIEAARRVLALIGQPAPALDAAAWVGTDAPLDLSGKVVLLDFWAVWCGPCIATFPHLRHLHEEYGDRGLQIVGVTRYYNYAWDADAARARKIDKDDAVVSAADEQRMLQAFMARHELPYPTIVTPAESEMQPEYGVTGIPQAVVIDQNHVVRLVKIGSGDENAAAIKDMIRQLLEDAESTAAPAE